MSGRFAKGQSGNPAGRPKKRRPHNSAFDIIFDKSLTVIQGGVERELTVDEALQVQTYHAALKGSRMAVRAVVKMIEKREAALEKLAPVRTSNIKLEMEHDADNANKAMLLLGICDHGELPPGMAPDDRSLKLATWAAQAGISRPGRRRLSEKDVQDIKRTTLNSEELKWPRVRGS